MIPPISPTVLLALAGALHLDVVLLLVSGVLFVAAALLSLDARNGRRQAAEDRTTSAWILRQAERLHAAIHAEDDFYPTVPVESDEDVDDAPAELGDPADEAEPTRPWFYRRRHKRTLRHAYAELGAREPFDIAAGWDDELAPVRRAPLTPVAAGAVEAGALDIEIPDDLAELFGRIEKVGAQ